MSTHHCHARGCDVATQPRMFMCARHWRMVPAPLKARIWATYRRGQERDKQPSTEYLEAASEARNAVAELERGPVTSPAPEPVEVQIHLPDEPRRDWPLEARLNGVVGRYAWNAEDQTWEGARAATTWPKIVARCLAWEFDLYSVPPTSGVAA